MAGHQEGGVRPKTMDPKEARPKGPTLSTSTSSFEALDPHDPQVILAWIDIFLAWSNI
jgi:hypothetical protein